MTKFAIRDRRKSPVTSMVEDGISTEDFPFAIEAPSPPFALGRVVALVHTEGDARLIAAAPRLLSVCEALLADADATQDDQAACRRLYNAWRQIRAAVAEAHGK